jgi:uncharacterized protein YbaR (Trm112 family)
MAVDPKLLEILVCPDDKAALEVVALPEAVCGRLVEHYQEQFKDEQPEVVEGLRCTSCGRVYPIVSEIPVMLVDEALSAEEVAG